MEIVPILSTIILVGTVATFILAVAAYVLYKLRELRGNAPERQEPAEVEPHVLMSVRPGTMIQSGDSTPAEAAMYMAPTGTTPPAGRYVERGGLPLRDERGEGPRLPQRAASGLPLSSFFWEYTDEGFHPRTPEAVPRTATGDKAGSVPDDDAR